jgi:multidrug efflux pump subunit AcrA (membrane-fusion protein)
MALLVAALPGDETSATPFPGAVETIIVEAPVTQFVHRRRLSAERVGVLDETPAEGEFVKAGDIVARLRDEVPRAILAVADAKAASNADIAATEKLAESERFEFEVMSEANAKAGGGRPPYPNSDVQRLRLKSEASALAIGMKRHEKRVYELQRDQARAELKSFQVLSPIDGLVTRIFKRSGEGVQASEAILEVVNTRRIRVEGRVTAAVAAQLKIGAPVRVSFPGLTIAKEAAAPEFESTLGFIDVTAEGVGTDRRVRIWTEIDNRDGILRDGLPARMTITTAGDRAPRATAEQPSPGVKK